MRTIRLAMVLLTIGLMAACGSTETDTESSATTATTITTNDASSTTTAPTTGPTETEPDTDSTDGSISGDVVYAVTNPVQTPPPLGDDGANGSGCDPGAGDLPDGIWFGILQKLTDSAVEFDLACWYSGEAANQAAAEDGETEIPVPNDYYIRNSADTLRTLPVDPSAPTWVVATEPTDGNEIRLWSEFVDDPSGFVDCPGPFCLAWLYVNDGIVTSVVSQYTP